MGIFNGWRTMAETKSYLGLPLGSEAGKWLHPLASRSAPSGEDRDFSVEAEQFLTRLKSFGTLKDGIDHSLRTISKTQNANRFYRELLALGDQALDAGDRATATLIFQGLAEGTDFFGREIFQQTRQAAQKKWDTLQGKESSAESAASFFRNLPKDLLHWGNMGGMLVAGPIFNRLYFRNLSKLAVMRRSIWTRGIVAEGRAAVKPFAAEVAGFWGVQRIYNEIHHPDLINDDPKSIMGELAYLAATLGPLKLGIKAGRGIYDRAIGFNPLLRPVTSLTRNQQLLRHGAHQLGAYAGVISGTAYVHSQPWSPEHAPENIWSAGLATVAHLHLMGLGLSAWTGSRYRTWMANTQRAIHEVKLKTHYDPNPPEWQPPSQILEELFPVRIAVTPEGESVLVSQKGNVKSQVEKNNFYTKAQGNEEGIPKGLEKIEVTPALRKLAEEAQKNYHSSWSNYHKAYLEEVRTFEPQIAARLASGRSIWGSVPGRAYAVRGLGKFVVEEKKAYIIFLKYKTALGDPIAFALLREEVIGGDYWAFQAMGELFDANLPLAAELVTNIDSFSSYLTFHQRSSSVPPGSTQDRFIPKAFLSLGEIAATPKGRRAHDLLRTVHYSRHDPFQFKEKVQAEIEMRAVELLAKFDNKFAQTTISRFPKEFMDSLKRLVLLRKIWALEFLCKLVQRTEWDWNNSGPYPYSEAEMVLTELAREGDYRVHPAGWRHIEDPNHHEKYHIPELAIPLSKYLELTPQQRGNQFQGFGVTLPPQEAPTEIQRYEYGYFKEKSPDFELYRSKVLQDLENHSYSKEEIEKKLSKSKEAVLYYLQEASDPKNSKSSVNWETNERRAYMWRVKAEVLEEYLNGKGKSQRGKGRRTKMKG